MVLFFYTRQTLGPCLIDNLLSILMNQFLKLLMVRRVHRHLFGLIARNVDGESFAVFPTLEVVVGTLGTLPNYTELAGLHVLNARNLLKKLMGR